MTIPNVQEVQKAAALQEIAKTLKEILNELRALRSGQMGKA